MRERDPVLGWSVAGVVGKAWDFVIHLCRFAGWKVGSLGLERVHVRRRRQGGMTAWRMTKSGYRRVCSECQVEGLEAWMVPRVMKGAWA